jgi:outer membrane protein OmpA-like peptidoglycan-associated protein
MKSYKNIFSVIISILLIAGCSVFRKPVKNEPPETAVSNVIDSEAVQIVTNPSLGAIADAIVGGSAGNIIGNWMDSQAKDLEQELPEAEIERIGEGIMVELSSAVMFELNKSDLSEESKEKLEKFATILNDYPDTNIEVQGHTDDTGSEAYNRTLSEKRAATVSLYLKQAGVDLERIISKGYGELLPKYDNTTEEGRAKNRRVEFVITANEKMIADAEKEAAI